MENSFKCYKNGIKCKSIYQLLTTKAMKKKSGTNIFFVSYKHTEQIQR